MPASSKMCIRDRYYTTWEAGFHFKTPFVTRIAKKVSLKEQVVDFKPQPVITRDNVTMQIDTVVFFQITDPKLFTYGVERLSLIHICVQRYIHAHVPGMTKSHRLPQAFGGKIARRAAGIEILKPEVHGVRSRKNGCAEHVGIAGGRQYLGPCGICLLYTSRCV